MGSQSLAFSLPPGIIPLAGGRDPFITKGVNVSFFRCDVTFPPLIFRVYFVTSLFLRLFFMFIL